MDERHQHLRGFSSIQYDRELGHTNDHSGNLEPVLGASDLACSATQLCVDLHGNVGAVLRLSLDNMSNIEA
jgi:hypothetical protein